MLSLQRTDESGGVPDNTIQRWLLLELLREETLRFHQTIQHFGEQEAHNAILPTPSLALLYTQQRLASSSDGVC